MTLPIFTAICNEPEGTVERGVYPLIFTPENLQKFWDKAKQFPTIYGMEIKDVSDFYNLFVNQSDGNLSLNGLFWVIDDFVGVFYLTDITGTEASVHYSFFDRRHKGRVPLVKKMLKFVFEKYKFRRINASIPLYTRPFTRHFASNIGFTLEGKKRKASFFKGDWYDVLQYGMLMEEVFPKPKENTGGSTAN